METVELVFEDVEMIVEGYYNKAEPSQQYLADMSGYPGSKESFDVQSILVGGNNVINLLSEEVISRIRYEALKNFSNE